MAPFTLHGQTLWRLDSLMQTWPVQKLALQDRKPPKQRVFPAVVTEGLYARLQKDAQGFPVFADTTVAMYADLLGEHRREDLKVALGLAASYFPMIERELYERGLPEQLKFLPLAASAMNILAGSNSGEAGLWMLTFPVALRYGLRVDATIDERHDAMKSTKAAAQYLQDLHAKYQDWPLAVMAFACGPANITRAITRTGSTGDYRALYPHFTDGHKDVMPLFMAMIHLGANAKKLGLESASIDPFEESDTLTTSEDLQLLQLSRILHLPHAQLRYLNPVHFSGRVPKGDLLHLPKGYTDSLRTALLVEAQLRPAVDVTMIENISDTVAAPPAMEEIEKKAKEPSYIVYTVRAGDSLYAIAKRYDGISAQTLKDLNRISDKIKPGQKIKIPKQ